jgi:hypothetical protein
MNGTAAAECSEDERFNGCQGRGFQATRVTRDHMLNDATCADRLSERRTSSRVA